MKKFLFLFISFLSFITSPAEAANKHALYGYVTAMKIFSFSNNPYSESGVAAVYIYVDTLPGACGGNVNRIAMRSTHPSYDTLVSLATTALMSGKRVRVGYVDECTIQGNAWDYSDFTIVLV